MYFVAIGRAVARVVIRNTVSKLSSRGSNRVFGSRNVKNSSSRNAVRERGKGFLKGFGSKFEARSELAEEIGELKEEAYEVVESAYYEALDTMFNMCANPGQDTVFENYIIEEFAKGVKRTRLRDGWEDVDIGEYMTFMGEIVEVGNQIMSEAYDEANSLMDEVDDIKDEIASMKEDGFDYE